MINLENFNPLDPLFPGFSSPRSKKALYRLAYNDHELLKKTENVLLAEEGPIPHHLLGFLGIKAEFYEQKRLEKVKKALEEREKIIEEDFEKEFKKAEREENSGVKIDNSSFIEKQKAKIEKMVGKKNQEIEFYRENERKKEEIKKKLKETQMKLDAKEAKLQENLLKKKEEAEYDRLIREQKFIDSLQKKEAETRLFLDKQEENDRKIKEKQCVLEEERRKEAEEKERKRRERGEFIEKKLKEMMEKKEREIRGNLRNREEKNMRIKEIMKQMQNRKINEGLVKKQDFISKISKIKLEKEEERIKNIENFQKHEQKIEYSIYQQEKRRKAELSLKQEKNQAKLAELQRKQENYLKLENEKKLKLIAKFEKIDKIRELSLQTKSQTFDMSPHLSFAHQKDTNEALNSKPLNSKKKPDFLLSLQNSLDKVTENRIKMLQELKQRQIINYLKENETHLNTKRLRQLEQNRKENLLLSIIAKESRLSESKALKVKALAERVKIEQDLQKEKEATLMGQVPQPKKHYKKEILEKSSKDKEIFVVSTENPPVKTVKKAPKKKLKTLKKDLSGFISEEYQKEAEEIKARSNEKVVNILEKDGEDLEDLGKEILEVLRNENMEMGYLQTNLGFWDLV